MRMWAQSHLCQKPRPTSSVLVAAFALFFLILGISQQANAIPAFARKYGLRCSACHESWPMLNFFGQKFKDNGYQLMNDRDAPIWQNPGYWPVTFRMTPIWHRVSTNLVATDQSPTGEQKITSSGFDLSGLDFHTGGTLEKNFSFYLLPSSDPTGAFHFETVMARIDNIGNSPWLNVKLGKFELDNLLSEKRILTLTANGGIYQLYHFIPLHDGNTFGQMGDNQLGLEVMGHSANDRTRYSVALLSSNDGTTQLPYGEESYSTFITGSQAFDAGKLGVQRLGFYVMAGDAPTGWLTSGGAPIAGSGIANKGYSREGFVGQFYFGPHADVTVVTQHGSDSAWFGQGYGDLIDGVAVNNNLPGGPGLPAGSRNPTWNGVLIEPHYVVSPQMILIGRYETIRMSQQANGPGYTGAGGPSPSDYGNVSTYTLGYRYNPFMTSRAGFAYHGEYNWFHWVGAAPDGTSNLTSSELLFGIDFDF
ncbi:MAG TPA: hypothetical protein VNU74_06365 [Terriglobales bacterium]|jgi:hypothetical protein|nr:hypothetical protein [Terriglobales bacterium]